MFNTSASSWSRLEDKLFERALVAFPENTPERWEKIACQVPGKSWADVRQHYEELVRDVVEIESGRVELPSYEEEEEGEEERKAWFGLKGKERETERRKGIPWTEEEHRLFLIGLEKYGKGDWRSISRNAVVSRTPTQVASHAQKYFLRLNSARKEKKRSSIHDITGGSTTIHDSSWAMFMDQAGINQLDDEIQIRSACQGFGFTM
ncbi:hypothetical protein K2173_013796 [Erythroxylum novogranatense]|uniref:Uncharacterized protein n=1 Tax=Erythroxylum novogranatense TaxID=1862640 RepID=A0AAV8SCY6_9ROSI|nr:hypothetical protein K2173_013796 [Erythroxylum novogranatense]